MPASNAERTRLLTSTETAALPGTLRSDCVTRPVAEAVRSPAVTARSPSASSARTCSVRSTSPESESRFVPAVVPSLNQISVSPLELSAVNASVVPLVARFNFAGRPDSSSLTNPAPPLLLTNTVVAGVPSLVHNSWRPEPGSTLKKSVVPRTANP